MVNYSKYSLISWTKHHDARLCISSFALKTMNIDAVDVKNLASTEVFESSTTVLSDVKTRNKSIIQTVHWPRVVSAGYGSGFWNEKQMRGNMANDRVMRTTRCLSISQNNSKRLSNRYKQSLNVSQLGPQQLCLCVYLCVCQSLCVCDMIDVNFALNCQRSRSLGYHVQKSIICTRINTCVKYVITMVDKEPCIVKELSTTIPT